MLLVLVFLLQTTAAAWISRYIVQRIDTAGLPGCFSDMGLWQRWHPRCEGHCMLLHAIAMKPTWMTWVNLEATKIMEIPETWALSLHQCQLFRYRIRSHHASLIMTWHYHKAWWRRPKRGHMSVVSYTEYIFCMLDMQGVADHGSILSEIKSLTVVPDALNQQR